MQTYSVREIKLDTLIPLNRTQHVYFVVSFAHGFDVAVMYEILNVNGYSPSVLLKREICEYLNV